jgi:hypothetical protein
MPQISLDSFAKYHRMAPPMNLPHTSTAKEISRRSSLLISSTRYERKSKTSALVVISATVIVALTISQGSDRVHRRIPPNLAATT